MFVKIPIDLPSKKSLRLLIQARKKQMNRPLTNHSSFDINNKYSLIKIQKNTKEFITLKGNDIFPLFKSQYLNKEYYKISTYKRRK